MKTEIVAKHVILTDISINAPSLANIEFLMQEHNAPQKNVSLVTGKILEDFNSGPKAPHLQISCCRNQYLLQEFST